MITTVFKAITASSLDDFVDQLNQAAADHWTFLQFIKNGDLYVALLSRAQESA